MSDSEWDFFDVEEKIEEITVKTEELKEKIKKEEKIEEKPIKTKPKPKIKIEDKYQKQIEDLVKKNEELTEMFLKFRETTIKEESPVVNAILKEFSTYSFNVLKQELMEENDIKQFDKTIKFSNGKINRELWNLKHLLDKNPELRDNQDRLDAVKYMNRVYRDGPRNYIYTVEKVKERVVKIIDKYSNN